MKGVDSMLHGTVSHEQRIYYAVLYYILYDASRILAVMIGRKQINRDTAHIKGLLSRALYPASMRATETGILYFGIKAWRVQ